MGCNQNTMKDLQGRTRRTSWKTNARMDSLILSLKSFETILCKSVKYGEFPDLQKRARAGGRSQSP